jgi:hypothetical protein
MDTSFIDNPVLFNPLLSELDGEDRSENEARSEHAEKRQKRYNGAARRKVEEYFHMKDLEKLSRDSFLDDLFLDNE